MVRQIMLVFFSGQWSNIAIRWINLRYNDTPSYIQLRSNEEFVGGLEVIIVCWNLNTEVFHNFLI